MSDYIIPEEILVQVLKRLPAKSLVRSRCVCKWWKQLIDSPSFVLDHLAFQKPQFFIANCYYDEPRFLLLDPRTLPLSHTPPYSSSEKLPRVKLALMGTLHGIVCLYEYGTMRSGAYLWNPSTRKLLNVPIAEYMHYYRDETPGCRYFMHTAFWIDPLTKHFKIVVCKIMYDCGSNLKKYAAIYSSIESDWKEISPGEFESIANCWININPALVMGKVAYWIAFDYTPSGENRLSRFMKRGLVVSFDFEQERFGSIEGPFAFLACDYYPLLWNWRGSLSLVYLDPEKRCHLYSRQEGSWVNLFSISLTPNISRVYCILKETEENDKILLAKTTDGELVLFDTNGFGHVTLKSQVDSHDFYDYMAHGFVESLVFP